MSEENASTDSQLMALLASGDRRPLGILYRRYAKMVASVVGRSVPALSPADGEDLCHEVFLTVVEQAPRYRDEGKFRGWLCGVAIKKARQVRRQRWWRMGLLERFSPKPSIDSGAVAEVESKIELDQALAKLNEGQREVMLLHIHEGFTGAEIAVALGIEEKTVWTRLHRARKNLQALLTDQEREADE